MKTLFALFLVLLTLIPFCAHGKPASDDSTHEMLRVLRTNIVKAIVAGDIETQLSYVHSNVVVTWQNHEVARGHQGLRDFYAKMGKNAFKGYKNPPTPDEISILHGNTAISFGESSANYELFGRPFEFKNRWTATLIREEGLWKLASYHVSLNALDNPLLQAAKRSLLVAAGLSGAIGIVLGVLIGRATRKTA